VGDPTLRRQLVARDASKDAWLKIKISDETVRGGHRVEVTADVLYSWLRVVLEPLVLHGLTGGEPFVGVVREELSQKVITLLRPYL